MEASSPRAARYAATLDIPASWRVRTVFFALALFMSGGRLFADTVFRASAQGPPHIVLSQCIVVSQSSSLLQCKHFDLKKRRVVIVQLEQKSLPYTVKISSPQSHQMIVNLWKEFGYTTEITDLQGKTTTLYDSYLDFFPPAGTFFLRPVPPATHFSIKLEGGGFDEIDFSKISKVEIEGRTLKITLRNGNGPVEQGTMIMPTTQPAVAHFMGITSQYSPENKNVFDFSIPLQKLKEIVFQ